MKALLIITLSFFTLHIFGQTPQPMRRFMQTQPSAKNALPYGNNPVAGRYVQAGDAKIYYEVYGQGRPLVILHGGIFGSTYEMAEFIDSFSKKYQVIAISTRGHGKSEVGTNIITYEQKANDVLAVINAVTKDSVVVLGFSDGAYAGFKLASMYPSRIRKLVAIGASELYPGLRNFSFDVKQALSYDTAFWKQQYALMPEPNRLQEMFTKLGNMYNQLTLNKDFFNTIQCPVLLLAGDHDQSNPPSRMVNTMQMIPNCALSIIPNTTHGAFLENFPAAWTAMIPFLKN